MSSSQNGKLQVLVLILLVLGMGATLLVSNDVDKISDTEEVSTKSMASRSLELKNFKKEPNINVKKENTIIVNDPAMNQKWGLKVTDSLKAWSVSKGSHDIVVAIIDTGIDTKHEDLKNNLWVNPGEIGKDIHGRDKRTNGFDDDGNGLKDDVHGWNFVSGNDDISDNHGHGTHIAGIIGAEKGNGKGVAGVSPNVSLMILKYYDPKAAGMNNLSNTVHAIRYAIKNGANIINYSGGGLEPSGDEKAAIALARKKGILVVAAAGNERSNSDLKAYYPADYDLDNIISVTAVNKGSALNGAGGDILPSSNFGTKSVDIAAPGNDILSTVPGGKYKRMTGTSQATAFVSGVAALIMANNPDLKAYQISKILQQTGDMEPSLKGKTRYKKRINSYRALSIVVQGAGVTGAIAQNTAALKPNTFTIQQTPIRKRSISSDFGQSLLKNIKSLNKKQLN